MDRLRAGLRSLGSVVVAWSGGADSSLLAWVAHDTLGRVRAKAVTAVSPSLPNSELEDCRALAREWDLDWSVVHTDEMERAAYRVNDRDRCAHCKHALLDVVGPLAEAGHSVVTLGVIVDDLGDDRPGQVIAAERGTVFPLVDAGFSKADVRRVSRELGLRTWDKPAAACLASRIPHGTEVTVSLLGRVERAEAALRDLGFGRAGPLRVRHRGTTARVEVGTAELSAALARRRVIAEAVATAGGYEHVELDEAGYKSPPAVDNL